MHCVIEHPANHGLADILFNVTHNHHKTEQYLGDGHRWASRSATPANASANG